MIRSVVVLLTSWLALTSEVRAQTKVDVELVLAVDISLSMDLDELRLQRDGYAAALRDPEIHALIARGPLKRIGLTYFEWAGPRVQKLIANWTLIDSPDAARRLASVIENAPISRERLTSISAAMDYADRLFDQSPFQGMRRVLDVSGDGPNNSGPHVTASRKVLVDKGIGINGLPIVLKRSNSSFDISDLADYFEDCVVGGPAAFVIPIRKDEEFAPAIRRKLLLEIAGHEPPARFVRAQARAPGAGPDTSRTDCLIGEKLFRRYMDGRFLDN